MTIEHYKKESTDPQSNLPEIRIRCASVEDLQGLVYKLIDTGVLTDDVGFELKNVPKNMLDILNNPKYFNKITICEITVFEGECPKINTEKLL